MGGDGHVKPRLKGRLAWAEPAGWRGWGRGLTVVIVRVHVEIGHLPTPDGAVEASAVAGVSVLPHRQGQNGSAGKADTDLILSSSFLNSLVEVKQLGGVGGAPTCAL